MLKKIIFSLLFLTLLVVPTQKILAQTASDVNIYFFWGEGCPHCAKEKPFLEKLEQKYSEVKVYDYEVWENSENRQLLIDFGKKLNANVSGVPFTVVGEKYFIGWMDEEYSGKQIEDAIKCVQKNSCRDIGKEITSLNSQNTKDEKENKEEDCDCEDETSVIPQKIDVPILGQIETKNLSLPLFTIILGALDGFNPCAMWTLLFLISLLLGMENRKRMWILGSAFIVASASVYFIFMAAWLNLILFIGLVVWVRIIIGLIALMGGGYNLKEYFTNPEAGCKVTGSEKRQKVFEKLKNITHQKSFYLALGGIIILAFAVNLVELICSAGLPAIYTQVLALSNLSRLQYYLYILLYIFIFMLDDLFIFFVAMTTLKITGITTKYSRWSHLIGGILMLIIGLLLIFKPEWLMFG
jgi:thiol-disulfide isomerase/thioredoxin